MKNVKQRNRRRTTFFLKLKKENEKQVDMGIKLIQFNKQKEKLEETGNKRYDVDL